MFELITPVSYWVLTVLWMVILWIYLSKLRQSENLGKTVSLLLVILSIDAFRTLFESAYFGFYFNSLFGLLPESIYQLLSQPTLLIIPKIFNVIAGLFVLFLLIRHWVPREMREREEWIVNLEQAKNIAELKKNEAEHQTRKFESIFNGISDAIVLVDTDRRIVSINKGLEKMFGFTIDELAGRTTSVLYESEEEYEHQGHIRFNMTAEEKAAPYEVNYRRKNGQVFVGETLGTAVHLADGSISGFIGVIRDVTERKQNEEKLKLAASVFTHAREGIMITDATGAIIDVNDTFTHITGYSREEILGKNPRILKSGRQGDEFYADLWKSLQENKHWYGEIWNRRKNGEVYAELITISAVCDANDQVQHYVALFLEITQIKEHQQQLEHSAHYDSTTGLPNRVLLADRLQNAMSHCQRRNQSLAVAYLDLDGFKFVNDSYGHDVGDKLLIALSQRMKEALREGDTLARLGGDEFVAVLVDIQKMADCEPILLRLLKAAADSVTIDSATLQVSTSIGVTLYPQDGVDADQLMRHADHAMYVAKQLGKNRYHIFDVHQDLKIKSHRENLEQINKAIENDEFLLHYQPKVNMVTGEVIGAEALIRWQHPELGLLLPIEFLPTVENHPLSLSVGDWVIETALVQMEQWHDAGLDIPVSVNVAAYQLQHEKFVFNLMDALVRHPQIKPSCVELEILETSALQDIAEISSVMYNCRDIGVSFALDDFGTGYSSLTHLKRLPADLLKIDQSFVRDMLEDPDDRAIVNGVISLASAFNRKVIAEGVETTAHGVQLILMGCELAQGYGIARPMSASDMPEWVANWKPDESWEDLTVSKLLAP
jgi:diguanylate cyclase (GGDEF)-like protein/PAS domain S-box-containing protein